MDLDKTDKDILRHLRADCRLSNAELADRVGLSSSSCWRRVRALEEAGVIKGYGARISDRQIGLEFQAIVQVHMVRHDPALVHAFVDAVKKRDDIRDCYATTGTSDYHLLVKCRDLNAYNRFLEEFLFHQPAVSSAHSHVVLRSIKQEAG